MKNLMLVLVLLVSGLVYSQSHNDTLEKWYNENRLAVEKEFVRLIDSARSNLTVKKQFIYRSSDGLSQKELKSIKQDEESKGSDCQVVKQSKGNKINFIIVSKQVPVIPMKYDSILSLASNHHAEYLVEVGNEFVSHDEVSNKSYSGQVLTTPIDRVNYYSKGITFFSECLHTYISDVELSQSNLFISFGDITISSISQYFFLSFNESKNHWNLLTSPKDIGLMGVSFVMDFNNSEMSFVTVMGNDKETIETDLFVNN